MPHYWHALIAHHLGRAADDPEPPSVAGAPRDDYRVHGKCGRTFSCGLGQEMSMDNKAAAGVVALLLQGGGAERLHS